MNAAWRKRVADAQLAARSWLFDSPKAQTRNRNIGDTARIWAPAVVMGMGLGAATKLMIENTSVSNILFVIMVITFIGAIGYADMRMFKATIARNSVEHYLEELRRNADLDQHLKEK